MHALSHHEEGGSAEAPLTQIRRQETQIYNVQEQHLLLGVRMKTQT